MADQFVVLPRSLPDTNIGAPIRRLPADQITAYVDTSNVIDIVEKSDRFSDGTWLQLIATDRPGVRAVAQITDLQEFPSFGEAVTAIGDALQLFGETIDEFIGRTDPQRGNGEVIAFRYSTVRMTAPPPPIIPPAEPNMQVYDTVHFQSLDSPVIGVVSIHATDLESERRTIANAKYGNSVSEAGLLSAQQGLLDGETRLVVDLVGPDNQETIFKFGFNSAPVIIYAQPDDFSENPETICSDGGIQMGWSNSRVLLTQGREAIRCLISRLFGHIVIVYERQIEILPIALFENGIQCDLVICNMDVTIKLLEAANLLLHNDNDTAMVAVHTPETACATTNIGAGWFVIEGNIPADRVERACADAGQDSLRINSKAEAVAYLAESWRNFVHVRYENGHQAVIMHPRMRYASRAASLPLQRVQLRECKNLGGQYMGMALRGAAARVLEDCCYYATLKDFSSKKSEGPSSKAQSKPLYDTRPLFFDHHGQLRYSELKKQLEQNFEEVVGKDDAVWLRIDPDFAAALDSEEPQLIRYTNTIGARQLILEKHVTGTQIFEGYMERLLRALISAIYVCYGHRENPTERVRSGRLDLAHIIYRGALATIKRRERAYHALTVGYDWLTKNQSEFPPKFRLLWHTAFTHQRAAQAPVSKHKELVIAYSLNRSIQNFNEIESYLNSVYARCSATMGTPVTAAGQRRKRRS